ncbi:MAG: ROK family protein [Acidimicrobiia bacterium]|nr:ROK family protein [Acidimicrobiia bacterium]
MGVDIGGTGIKGAPVDLGAGELAEARRRIPTPHPATPDAVAATVAEVVGHFDVGGRIGCTFPAVIQHGVALTAANVDKSWKGSDARTVLEQATGRPVTLLNDADAAGMAEMEFGAGRGRTGLVAMVTLGTGIGTALFVDGVLVPNTELGHIEIKGRDAETWASEKVREDKGLKWKKWAKRVSRYLQTLEALVNPELIIIGGGVSKKSDKYFEYIDVRAELVAAQLRNEAGIVGAAVAASKEA